MSGATQLLSRGSFLPDGPTLCISLSSGTISGVGSYMLRSVSLVARGLPADAVKWDLSNLRIEGQPVQRQTVLTWLTKAYQHVFGEPFADHLEEHQPHVQPVTARSEQNAQQGAQQGHDAGEGGAQQSQRQADVSPEDNFEGRAYLLLFADAVGSAPPLLHACASGLGQLQLNVQLPERPLSLSVSRPYFWQESSLWVFKAEMIRQWVQYFPKNSMPSIKTATTAQVQQQTELLLYTAYKLQLEDLTETVHNFIRRQTRFPNSLLMGGLRPIMSPRVREAAAWYTSLQELLLLNTWTTELCDVSWYNLQALGIEGGGNHTAAAKPLEVYSRGWT